MTMDWQIRAWLTAASAHFGELPWFSKWCCWSSAVVELLHLKHRQRCRPLWIWSGDSFIMDCHVPGLSPTVEILIIALKTHTIILDSTNCDSLHLASWWPGWCGSSTKALSRGGERCFSFSAWWKPGPWFRQVSPSVLHHDLLQGCGDVSALWL